MDRLAIAAPHRGDGALADWIATQPTEELKHQLEFVGPTPVSPPNSSIQLSAAYQAIDSPNTAVGASPRELQDPFAQR